VERCLPSGYQQSLCVWPLQIDDLFLATEEPFVTTNSYRMTPADSQALATFAANVPALPAGSSFRVLPLCASCYLCISLLLLLRTQMHPPVWPQPLLLTSRLAPVQGAVAISAVTEHMWMRITRPQQALCASSYAC
jgi:hypothetical protein